MIYIAPISRIESEVLKSIECIKYIRTKRLIVQLQKRHNLQLLR